jgi:hypothetical protein
MTLSRFADDLGTGDEVVRVGRDDRQRAAAAELDHEPPPAPPTGAASRPQTLLSRLSSPTRPFQGDNLDECEN